MENQNHIQPNVNDSLYESAYNSTVKNYSYCMIDGQLYLFPNSSIKLLSILYRHLETIDMEIYKDVEFIFDTRKITSIGPSNFSAIKNGIQFLWAFRRDWVSGKQSALAWRGIVDTFSITVDSIKVKFSTEFLITLSNNIQSGIPFIKTGTVKKGTTPVSPIHLNI